MEFLNIHWLVLYVTINKINVGDVLEIIFCSILGSFLVMVMKMVSLGFDVESWKNIHGEKQHPSVLITPNVAEYISYCIFPSTTVFGPFLTYNQHKKFLSPSPLVCKYFYQYNVYLTIKCSFTFVP